jgi:hypothetical protein
MPHHVDFKVKLNEPMGMTIDQPATGKLLIYV